MNNSDKKCKLAYGVDREKVASFLRRRLNKLNESSPLIGNESEFMKLAYQDCAKVLLGRKITVYRD